jgi:predicted RNase H-like nuclease (RuvC/YqgF family)
VAQNFFGVFLAIAPRRSIIKLMDNFLWGLGGALVMFVIGKVWEKIQKSSDTIIDDLRESLKESSLEIKELTRQMIKLEGTISRLDEKVSEIPEIKKDLNSIGEKLRKLQAEFS